MEHIQLPVHLMEFRCPQQPADTRISLRIQEKLFLCRQNPFQCVGTAHVERVVVIRIVGGNKIILSVPVHADRIRPMLCKRRRKMFLMHSAPYHMGFFLRRLFPVDLTDNRRPVAVGSDRLHILKLLHGPERPFLG